MCRGLLPTHPEDIPENRRQLKDIIFSTYAACTEPDPEGEGKEFLVRACGCVNQYDNARMSPQSVCHRKHELIRHFYYSTIKMNVQ